LRTPCRRGNARSGTTGLVFYCQMAPLFEGEAAPANRLFERLARNGPDQLARRPACCVLPRTGRRGGRGQQRNCPRLFREPVFREPMRKAPTFGLPASPAGLLHGGSLRPFFLGMASLYPLRPAAEAHRLQALRPYQLVTAIPDPLFDELIRLTARLFSVPIAIIALVEATTVQFRLNVGLPPGLQHVPRAQSLCSVALLREETTVYENLPQNPCALAEPGLVEQLNLQFYAGQPLRTPAGEAIGVLCVLAHQPRSFADADRALLVRLATLTMEVLALRLHATYEPGLSDTLWNRLYDQVAESVNRLGTLAALAQWEEHAHTAGAVAYQHSTREEISRVLDALQAQLQRVLP